VADLVESKPLSGFQDLLPADALALEHVVERARTVFRRYGYAPIDAPCIYRYETLTGGRAGIDKQLFEWHKADARGEGDHLALRFDLTVPLARYVAANAGKLAFPFRAHHVGKVWRGERAQRGRYREFYQCDFDVVGTTAASADLEIALVAADVLAAIDPGPFQVRLNDRAILNGLLASLTVADRAADVLRVMDKLDKAGEDAVRDELARPDVGERPGLGIGDASAEAILAFTRLSREAEGDALMAALATRFAGNPAALFGVERLRFVLAGARRLRGAERFAVDLSIARGLGYYTGTVYETVLLDAPGFGSVCSGGRYDDLASYYSKQRFPGVGGSVGLSRLLAAVGERAPAGAARRIVLVATAPGVDPLRAVEIADRLRQGGVAAEVYPQPLPGAEDPARLKKQIAHADASGAALVAIVAPDELARDAIVLRDMAAGTQEEVPLADAVARVQARLAP
jgi:histidyl-tRNA synthetase